MYPCVKQNYCGNAYGHFGGEVQPGYENVNSFKL